MNTIRRAVDIRHHEGEWHVDRASGKVTIEFTAKDAAYRVLDDDFAAKEKLDRDGVAAILVTVISWHNLPADFTAPVTTGYQTKTRAATRVPSAKQARAARNRRTVRS